MEQNTLDAPAVYSVNRAASYLGISRRTLERLAASSAITYVRVSEGRRGFRVTDLDAYLEQRAVHGRGTGAA
jgi:excisionase family DNA binding protein